jgi:hypothetical protein
LDELEHWLPSKVVPAAQVWQTPLIKLYPAEQSQVAPFHLALAPQDAPEGSHCPEAVLRTYPVAHEASDEHLAPFQLVPEAQVAQALMSLW